MLSSPAPVQSLVDVTRFDEMWTPTWVRIDQWEMGLHPPVSTSAGAFVILCVQVGAADYPHGLYSGAESPEAQNGRSGARPLAVRMSVAAVYRVCSIPP